MTHLCLTTQKAHTRCTQLYSSYYRICYVFVNSELKPSSMRRSRSLADISGSLTDLYATLCSKLQRHVCVCATLPHLVVPCNTVTLIIYTLLTHGTRHLSAGVLYITHGIRHYQVGFCI